MSANNNKRFLGFVICAMILSSCTGKSVSTVENTPQSVNTEPLSTTPVVERPGEFEAPALSDLPEPGDPFTMPTTRITADNINQVFPLARIYPGEIGGKVSSFSITGKLLGINSENGVYLFDTSDRSLSHLVYEHSLMAISQDAQYLVTAYSPPVTGEQSFYVWDYQQQEIKAELKTRQTGESRRDAPYGPYVRDMSFSNDGQRVFAFEVGNNTFQSIIWNASNGHIMQFKKPMDYKFANNVIFSKFTILPDNETVAIEYSQDSIYKIALYSFPHGKFIRELPEANYHGVSSSGNIALTAEEEVLTDLPTGNWKFSFYDIDSDTNINSVIFPGNPEGRFVTGLSQMGNALAVWDDYNDIAYIWNKSGALLGQFSIDLPSDIDPYQTSLLFSADEKSLMLSAPSEIVVIDIASGQVIKTLRAGRIINGMAIHPAEDLLAVSYGAFVEIYMLSTRQLLTTLTVSSQHDGYGGGVAFSSDGMLLFTPWSYPESNQIWRTSDWTPISFQYPLDLSMPESLNADTFIINTRDGLSMSPIQGSQISYSSIYPPTSSPMPIKVSPNQKYLAYASGGAGSGSLVIFDVSRGLSAPALGDPLPTSDNVSLWFSPSSDYLMMSSHAGIKVWDLSAMKLKYQFSDVFDTPVFSADSSLLFFNYGAINLKTGETTSDSPVNGQFFAVSSDGTIIVTASNGILTYWGIP